MVPLDCGAGRTLIKSQFCKGARRVSTKLLFIHADSLSFEARSPAIKSPPNLSPESKKGEAQEALVVFYSVEEGDGADLAGIVQKSLGEIASVQSQVKAQQLVLYPYAHLSNRLAKPDVAQKAGEMLVESAASLGLPVITAPFGYYKAFTLKAKGHPLAELSRTVSLSETPPASSGKKPTQKESAALTKEKAIRSAWYVLSADGEVVPANEFLPKAEGSFRSFYQYETGGSRSKGEEPPHVRLMREQELVDYEPGSDSGNFRWYPKGQLIKRLLEERVSQVVANLGGMRVETPIMYDYEHPALKKYLDRFPARQYVIESDDKDFFLRFAACFGQYLIFHDMTIGAADLPVRLYELSHYSFRREQSGELSGLRRLRTFTMPDMHSLVADVDSAKQEYLAQFRACKEWMDDLGVPYNVAVRFTREFLDANRPFARELSQIMGRPLLLEVWDDRIFYFVMKAEFHPLDTQGRAAALSTVQIDVENGERFGITYTGSDGAKHHPLILHASISGAIERNLYAILEDEAARIAKGGKGSWPFWLSPTQVRVIPVTDQFNEAAKRVAEEIQHATAARIDVDDREETVGKKIRDAEREWVPLTLVYGDKEAKGDRLAVRRRGEKESAEVTLSELSLEIGRRQGGRPWLPLPLPVLLSHRPKFRG